MLRLIDRNPAMQIYVFWFPFKERAPFLLLFGGFLFFFGFPLRKSPVSLPSAEDIQLMWMLTALLQAIIVTGGWSTIGGMAGRSV